MGHYFLWQIDPHKNIAKARRTITLDPGNYPMHLSGVPNRANIPYFENTKLQFPLRKRMPSQIEPFAKPALVCVEKAIQGFQTVPAELKILLAAYYSGQNSFFVSGSMLDPCTHKIIDVFLGEASPNVFPARMENLRFSQVNIALEVLVDPTAIIRAGSSQEDDEAEELEAELLGYRFEAFLVANDDEPRNIERLIQEQGVYYKQSTDHTVRFTAADIHALPQMISASRWSKSLHPFLLAAGYALNESAQLQRPYSGNIGSLAAHGYPLHVLDCDIEVVHDVCEKYISIVTEMPAGAREFMQKGQAPKAKIVRTYKIDVRKPSNNILEEEKRVNV